MIKMLVFDIDGVVTDGKKYTDGKQTELKSVQLKDLDAIGELSKIGFRIGCISGEDTDFSRQFQIMEKLDFVNLGCKDKLAVLQDISAQYQISLDEIVYVGDGKYDIPVLREVGLGICPKDAIEDVKKVSDIILECRGGEGCLAEILTLFQGKKCGKDMKKFQEQISADELRKRILSHDQIVKQILENEIYCNNVMKAVWIIIESYRNNGHLFLCGNGGSAADAQHLAAELVGKFYVERRAYNAEALNTNTSIITALANDYGYDLIFSRQLEAKGTRGDVLIGITTSGTSGNVYAAFKTARQLGISTILMCGDISEFFGIMEYTDILLKVPSRDTPRIQEMHIMTGHIMCEFIEKNL